MEARLQQPFPLFLSSTSNFHPLFFFTLLHLRTLSSGREVTPLPSTGALRAADIWVIPAAGRPRTRTLPGDSWSAGASRSPEPEEQRRDVSPRCDAEAEPAEKQKKSSGNALFGRGEGTRGGGGGGGGGRSGAERRTNPHSSALLELF